jgi:RNA polymerase sigma-70 factor (ECF subfamily)
LYNWLYRIMYNEWLTSLRRKLVTYEGDMSVFDTATVDPSQHVSLELKEALQHPWSGLPLKAAQGYSYESMAAEDNIAIGTVKSRINRGRAKMKEAGL